MTAQLQRPRSINDGPWCWQRKEVLQLINDAFSESSNDRNRVISARSVYVALTELASDNCSETFTATKALIAHKAGVSVSTVERVLNGFEQLGIVRIERKLVKQSQGAINAPNTYTLLSLPPRDVTPLRKTLPDRLTDKVKERKEKKESTPKGAVHAISTSEMPLTSFSRNGRGHSLSSYTDEEQEKIGDYDRFIETRKQKYGEKWFRVNRYSDEVRKALEIHGDPEEFRKFLQGLSDEDSIPDQHSLVRLCWHNY